MKILSLNSTFFITQKKLSDAVQAFGSSQKNDAAAAPALIEKSAPLGDFQNMLSAPSYKNRIQTLMAYKPIIKEGLKELNKKELVLIMHGSSFPSAPGTDTGYGNPNSTGARQLIDFISGIFTGIQLGPGGKTKSVDSSPYAGTLFSSNPLFVDLEQLTTEKWGKILPKKEFNLVVANNNKYNKSETNYSYIYKAQDDALKIAYKRFINNDKEPIKTLKKEFEQYKTAEENNPWLENDALYEALSLKYNTDYWPSWSDDLDKNLIAQKDTPQGKERIAELKNDYAKEIDYYKFVQFVYSKQIADTKEYANSKNVKLIADKQVGISDRDKWAHQDLLLKGWSLGAPPDDFSKDGQSWRFPVFDPKKLFNPDGSLGEAGELLKKSFVKIFKEYDSLRIDHFLGLVDPWVYPENASAKAEDGAGRLYSSPHNDKLKEYSIINSGNIDKDRVKFYEKNKKVWSENDYIDKKSLSDEQIEKYALYVDKIVLDAAKEALVDKNKQENYKKIVKTSENPQKAAIAEYKLQEMDDKVKNAIIAEDLGAVTTPAAIVMKKLNLNGIKVSQFMDPRWNDSPYLPSNISDEDKSYWYMTGSHDNKPVSLWAKDRVRNAQIFKNPNEMRLLKKIAASAEETESSNKAKELLGEIDKSVALIEYTADYLYKNNPNYEEYKERMFNDPKFLLQAQYAMILKSPAENLQVFFSDLLGDERIYNTPGTPPEKNWYVRADNNFELQYNNALNKDMALNLPTSIKIAIQSRLKDEKASTIKDV